MESAGAYEQLSIPSSYFLPSARRGRVLIFRRSRIGQRGTWLVSQPLKLFLTPVGSCSNRSAGRLGAVESSDCNVNRRSGRTF